MKRQFSDSGRAEKHSNLPRGLLASPTSDIRDPVPLLIAALSRLSPDGHRAAWEATGSIIFNLTGGGDIGFYLFRDWSRRGRKHRSHALIGASWARFVAGGAPSRGLKFLEAQLHIAGHDVEEVRAEAACYRLFQAGVISVQGAV